MKFPIIPENVRIGLLEPPSGKIRLVLDTDAYNEIDDQFAIAYALLSPQRLSLEAIYAAPFHNARSSGPADGMDKSHDEILRLLDRMHRDAQGFVFKGSTAWLSGNGRPCESAAASDLVERAMRSSPEDPLYVAAIGAITDVASAILMEPRIIEHIVVVWLGGHGHHWKDTREFNCAQDAIASRLIFDCGVPLVQIPCMGVTSHLTTTAAEIDQFVSGRGELGEFLAGRFREYHGCRFAWSKEIWDIAAIAYLVNPDWVPTELVHSPLLTDQLTWGFDSTRHLVRYARMVKRDPIFGDLFTKLDAYARQDSFAGVTRGVPQNDCCEVLKL